MALLEGTSLLLLLFVAMPLKYQYGMPEYVSLVGRAHGGLFIAFNVVLFYHVGKGHLSETKGFLGLLASLVPFGTFVYKAKVLKAHSA
ncbi:putative membrane protein YdzA [Thiomicrorhabdus immobilis]|uniref:Membrane protein YdzA n=2 Tax=Thiomicrorhabdus immobilis TaxID=2791037 RepID=A0ABM7MF22_9GAMM|nr:putative membrane protein YdzA [Thiomicrorhabdus immobilis]